MSFVIAQHAVDLTPAAHAAGDGAAPALAEWLMLVPAGKFQGRDGRGPYTSDAEAVIARTRAWHGAVDIPIDYDHQLVLARAHGGQAPAAGWVTELEARAGAVWGRVRWTARASAHIAAEEYRYLSPVIPADAEGRVQLLHSVALVNAPNFDLPVAAVEHLHAALAHVHPEKEHPVDPILKALLETLGIAPEGLQPEAASAHAASVVAKAKALDGVIAGLGLAADTKPEAVAAGVTALKAKADAVPGPAAAHAADVPDPAKWVPKDAFDALAADVAKLKQASLEGAAHAAVAKAMEDGKVSPALQGWAHSYATKDPEGFAAWLDAAPVIVSPSSAHSSRPPTGPLAGVPAGLTADEAHVAQAMGISPEDFLKAKKEGA